MPSPVQKLVVLMFENRSFDHLFGGYLPPGDGEVDTVPDGATLPLDSDGESTADVVEFDAASGNVTDPSPGHEFEDVDLQIFGTQDHAPDAAPKMNGFLVSYAGYQKDADKVRDAGRFYGPGRLHALWALAEKYVLFDRWFSSLPGPTWPNRFFAHCATSGGLTGSPDGLHCVWDEDGVSQYPMKSVYESIPGKDFAIYFHDIPQALGLGNLHPFRDRFRHIQEFYDAADAGTLPSYSFLEPGFFQIPGLDGEPNDMHPPHDIRNGDALIAKVYQAVASPKTWNHCALLIVWDEHGGFYDHVVPPPATPPDNLSDNGFKFDCLGVRVPALLVSPYVDAGVVDHAIYDHSSIPATVKKLLGLPNFLTRRDAVANTFDVNFTRSDPRAPIDLPPSVAPVPVPPGTPASSFQTDMLNLAKAIALKGNTALKEQATFAEHAAMVKQYLAGE